MYKPNKDAIDRGLFIGARVVRDDDKNEDDILFIREWDPEGDAIVVWDERGDDPSDYLEVFSRELILKPYSIPSLFVSAGFRIGAQVAYESNPTRSVGKIVGINARGRLVVRNNDLLDDEYCYADLTVLKSPFDSKNSSLNEKKEKKMAPITTTPKKAKHTTMTPAKQQKDSILAAVGQGFKLASANQAGEVILSLGEKILGDSAPAFMKDDNGREVVKLMTALLIATTVRSAPEFMENSDNIAKVCDLQITHSTDMLSTRLLSTGREQLQQLAALGIDIARSR